MRTLGLLVCVLLLALAFQGTSHAAGLQRSPVPAGEVQPQLGVAPGAYRWDPAAQLRDWADFHVRLTIPLWIPGMTGTFANSSGDIEGPDGGVGDELFEADGALSFAMMGRLEVRFGRGGRWGVGADGFAATITQNLAFKPTGREQIASGDITGLLIRADVNYKIGERWLFLGDRLTRLSARAYAGVRHYNIHLVVNHVLGFDIQRDVRAEWYDPIVGLRVDWDVSRKFSVRLEGDIGGFGVGSEMAYWGSIFAEWRFARFFSVALGYSVLDFERHFTVAREKYKWESLLYGPTLALSFKL